MAEYTLARSGWRRFGSLALLLAAQLTTGCSDGSDTPAYRPAVERILPTTVEQAANLPGYNIYRPAQLTATGRPLPLIVWGNGGCVRYDGVWSPLLEKWASAGFVVIAPTTPEDGSDPRSSLTRPEDLAALIDWAASENQQGDSPFAGHFDMGRVVAAGNSCGGIIALSLASMDSRVQAVFVLSGSSTIPGAPVEQAAAVMGNIMVPVAWVIGGPEDIATTFATKDYELLPTGVPGYLVRRVEADHRTVSTDPAILLEVAEISTRWIDFSLYAHPKTRRELTDNPCTQCEPDTWRIESKNLDLHVAP